MATAYYICGGILNAHISYIITGWRKDRGTVITRELAEVITPVNTQYPTTKTFQDNINQ